MKTLKGILISTIVLFAFACGSSNQGDINSTYPEPWKDPTGEEYQKIGKALVKNNITGCGEYYVRLSAENKGEYLVACSRDGESWSYYLVWTGIDEVNGPYLDTIITAPR